MENIELLTGTIHGFDQAKKSTFLYAFDQENNVLHLRDKGKHDGTSLINSINTEFKKKVLAAVQSDHNVSIGSSNVRCFIYTDGDSGYPDEVDEVFFPKEESSNNVDFRPAKKEDRPLLHWYDNKPKNNNLPDFLK